MDRSYVPSGHVHTYFGWGKCINCDDTIILKMWKCLQTMSQNTISEVTNGNSCNLKNKSCSLIILENIAVSN